MRKIQSNKVTYGVGTSEIYSQKWFIAIYRNGWEIPGSHTGYLKKNGEKTKDNYREIDRTKSRREAIMILKKYHPNVKLVGFYTRWSMSIFQ